MTEPRLLFDKIWDAHCVRRLGGDYDLVYVDRHVMHELASDVAFASVDDGGHPVRRPDLCFATHDHVVSSAPDRSEHTQVGNSRHVDTLRSNCRKHGIKLFDIAEPEQGIVHVLAPEQGIALPGLTLACGDSHTCTVGGLGALAWGIGTSELAHVLATQTIVQRRPKVMRVNLSGRLADGVSAKDLILALIGQYGASAADGYALEFCGETTAALDIEARLTLCNLSIEMGARMGQVAPDDATYEYLAGRPYAPHGQAWDQALDDWRQLPSHADAVAAREISFTVDALSPQVTWGTSPAQVAGVEAAVPDPAGFNSSSERVAAEQACEYMGLKPGERFSNIAIDKVFIGSCTNSRLSDLRTAAALIKGRQVADGVRAMVVPGSKAVLAAAEVEGLDQVFLRAGFEWRRPGCSMCIAMNGDQLQDGERCVSTSNRNFQGRQGRGGRTHLASPATAAASAVSGRITDPRTLLP